MTRVLQLFGTLPRIGLVALALGGCVEASDGTGDGAADDTQGDDGNVDDGGGDDGAPAAADVEGCRGSCDDLLFYDCLDADLHEACYAVCPERAASEIDLFTACVDNTLPTCGGCYDNLVDADPVGGDDGTAGSSCIDACEEWVGAGCESLGEFDSCEAFCGSLPEKFQDFVSECIAARDGCTLPEECTV